MIYQIVIIEPNGKRKKTKNYDNLKSAEKKIKKSYSKKQTRIIILPKEYNIGLKLYKPNGELYGTIVRDSDSFFYIQKTDSTEEHVFLKSNFEEKFIKELLFCKVEE
jgi:hypothetical protein